MTDLQWWNRVVMRGALLKCGREDLAIEWEPTAYRKDLRRDVLGSAWRTGYSDGLADLHDAPVHNYSRKPRWYGWPAGWRRYLDGWHTGQRDLRFTQTMWTTDELEAAA